MDNTVCKRLAAAGVLAAYAVAGGACDSGPSGERDAPVVRIGFGIGGTARSSGISNLADALYAESLLEKDWDGRTTPRLAEDLTWADEGRVLRLTLKRNVLLHDATPVTSDLITGLIRQMVPPVRRSPALGFEHVTSVSSPDARSVELRLSEPDLFLTTALTDLRILKPDQPDTGTGPFKLLRRSPVVETVRFEQYHGGLSPLGGVKIIPYDTHRAAWAALLRGEVDVVQEVNRDAVEFLAGSSTVQTYSSIQPFYVPLVFNLNHPLLKNVEVRRAISEAIDRREIVERAMRGRGRVADGPIWPDHWAYDTPYRPHLYDPAAAKARLDAAGFPQPRGGNSGELRSRFTLKCLVYAEDPQFDRIALLLQRQLFDIGVNLQLELTPLERLTARADVGDFETYLVQANASRTLDRLYRFWRSAGPNNPRPTQNSGYTGADAVLDQLRRSTSEEQIRSSVSALSRRFYEDAPAAFIAWLEVARAVDARFTVPDRTDRDPFINLWQWRLAPRASP